MQINDERDRTMSAERLRAGALTPINIAARLRAFGCDCVTHGDMTPVGKRMLDRIANGIDGTEGDAWVEYVERMEQLVTIRELAYTMINAVDAMTGGS